jgi:hypothetical protein
MPFLGILVNILIVFLIVGLVLYLIQLVPVPTDFAWVKLALRAIVIVFAVIWLIGVLAGFVPAIGYPIYPRSRL